MAIITRIVAGTPKTMNFPNMSPGISARMADMTKWDIEVNLGLHPDGKPFKRSDYRNVASLQTGQKN